MLFHNNLGQKDFKDVKNLLNIYNSFKKAAAILAKGLQRI